MVVIILTLKFLLGIGNQIKSTKIKVFENTP